jgi:hypothetical protein
MGLSQPPCWYYSVAESKQIGQSEDGSHIRVPIFYSNDAPTSEPCIIMKIPIPKVIDLVFFWNFAAFITNVLNSTSSNFYYIRWSGLYKNIICMNWEHIQHVTWCSDVIMERVVNSIHVVLGDCPGSTDRFFTDEHLPCISQDQLAKQTHCFSTMYLANIIPDNPRAGQKHWCFCMK